MGAMAMAMPFENLPLGFRFKPTDVELIDHYLRLKINGKDDEVACIREVDICTVEPWDLPGLSIITINDNEWFFFCPRDRKYPNGQRSNRATKAGYWKATGKDRTIKSRAMGLVGMKKTLVFHRGRAPKGHRTHWVIHEYRTTLHDLDGTHPGQGAYVLCRLFKKTEDHDTIHDDASNVDELETDEAQITLASNLQSDLVRTSNSITSETLFPHHSFSDPPYDRALESKASEEIHEVNSQAVKNTYDSQGTQEEVKRGTLNVEPISIPEIGDGHIGLQLQEMDERNPVISDFLDSVIINTESGKGTVVFGSDEWMSIGENDVTPIPPQQSLTREDPLQIHEEDDIFSDIALARFFNIPSFEEQMSEKSGDGNLEMCDDGNRAEIKMTSTRRQSPSNIVKQGSAQRRIRFVLDFSEENKAEATGASATNAPQGQGIGRKRIRLKNRSMFQPRSAAQARVIYQNQCDNEKPNDSLWKSMSDLSSCMIKLSLAIIFFIGLWKACNLISVSA